MTLTLFASGSTGNCALLSQGDTHLLLDAGLSARRIRERLALRGLTEGDLTGLLITHTHHDHIAGLAQLLRHTSFPLYATAPAARQLCYRLPLEGRVHSLTPGAWTQVGALAVTPVPTSHDSPGSAGYRFQNAQGRAACLLTDLGQVTDEVREAAAGVDLAVIECNHDLDCLRSGPYSYSLQARVAGPLGHLSNEEGAALCALAARTAHTLVLAHLSRQNNSPALALAAVERVLGDRPGLTVAVAPVLSDGVSWEV